MDEKREQVEELEEQLKNGKIDRRAFFRYVGALSISAGAATALTACNSEPVVVEKEVEVTREVEVIKEVLVPSESEPAAGLQKAVGHIVHDPEMCVGCGTCMAVCSLSHHGVVSPQLSSIQVVMFAREGALIEANTCQQCEGPECMSACTIAGAMYIDEVTGARVIDTEKCIGCGECQKACPNRKSSPHYYGDGLAPIRFDAANEKYFKCDLCGGDPQCVKFCPKEALSLSGIGEG